MWSSKFWRDAVPEHVLVAAKRGFLRTASQSLATALVVPTGITFALTSDFWVSMGVGVAGMALSAIVNGAQSFFSIISKGIPDEYQGQ